MRILKRAIAPLCSLCLLIAVESNLWARPSDVPGSDAHAAAESAQGANEKQSGAPLEVTYQNGKLSIRADNCSLRDVLDAIRSQTGVKIEAPATTIAKKVVANIPAGNPSRVLTALLQDNGFDFILVRPAATPDVLQELTVLQRPVGIMTASLASAAMLNLRSDFAADRNAADKDKRSSGNPDDSQLPLPPGVSRETLQAMMSGYFGGMLSGGGGSSASSSGSSFANSASAVTSSAVSATGSPSSTPIQSAAPVTTQCTGLDNCIPHIPGVPDNVRDQMCQTMYGMSCLQIVQNGKTSASQSTASTCPLVLDPRTQSMRCAY